MGSLPSVGKKSAQRFSYHLILNDTLNAYGWVSIILAVYIKGDSARVYIKGDIAVLFWFNEGVSTTQCIHVINETINYYNFNKTNVHMLFLDASKAFDRVRYCKLFKCQ